MSVAKLHHVQKAQKARKCGKCGTDIGKGQPYRWFQVGFRSRLRQIRCTAETCYPPPSVRESSKVSVIMGAQESFYDNIDELDTQESIESAVAEVAEAVREVADEYQEALDNWPSGNSNLEEKVEHYSSQADTLESWTWDGDEEPEESDYEDAAGVLNEESFQQAREEWLDEVRAAAREAVEEVEFL